MILWKIYHIEQTEATVANKTNIKRERDITFFTFKFFVWLMYTPKNITKEASSPDKESFSFKRIKARIIVNAGIRFTYADAVDAFVLLTP